MGRLRFGPSIKKARLRLGITQSELGKKLDPQVSQPTVGLWENQKLVPSDNHKAQLRRILGSPANQNETSVGFAPLEEADIDATPSAIGSWLNKFRIELGFSVPELASKAGLSSLSIYHIESGRSQNPWSGTVAKLEKALGRQLPTELKAEAKEEATIEGVGEWFTFDPSSDSEWPNEPGIYVLYDISNRPIYIGQGQNISARLRNHKDDKWWFRVPLVQEGAYITIQSKDLREKIERVLIKFLRSNAVLNKQNVER